MSELASRLRSYPSGDPTLAFGAAALAVATGVAFIRMQDSWAAFPLLLLVAIPCLTLFAVALLPGQGGNPIAAAPDGRLAPWQTACLLFAIPLLAASILQLIHVFGKDDPGTGTATWVLILTGIGAAVVSIRLQSPGATVLAAVAFAAAALTAIDWIDSSAKLATYRDIVLIEGLVFLSVARSIWTAHSEHAKQLVAVGGLGLIAGAVIGNAGNPAELFFGFPSTGSSKDGWMLVLIIATLGLFAFAAWARHGGSAFVGVVGLYGFLIFTSPGGNLSGWPLLLLLATIVCFVWALVVRPAPADRGRA